MEEISESNLDEFGAGVVLPLAHNSRAIPGLRAANGDNSNHNFSGFRNPLYEADKQDDDNDGDIDGGGGGGGHVDNDYSALTFVANPASTSTNRKINNGWFGETEDDDDAAAADGAADEFGFGTGEHGAAGGVNGAGFYSSLAENPKGTGAAGGVAFQGVWAVIACVSVS